MKDSQRQSALQTLQNKYIKESNERFSTTHGLDGELD